MSAYSVLQRCPLGTRVSEIGLHHSQEAVPVTLWPLLRPSSFHFPSDVSDWITEEFCSLRHVRLQLSKPSTWSHVLQIKHFKSLEGAAAMATFMNCPVMHYNSFVSALTCWFFFFCKCVYIVQILYSPCTHHYNITFISKAFGPVQTEK